MRKTTGSKRGGRDRGNYIGVKCPCPPAMMYACNVLSLVPPNPQYVLYRDHAISEMMTETMVYLWNPKENASVNVALYLFVCRSYLILFYLILDSSPPLIPLKIA